MGIYRTDWHSLEGWSGSAPSTFTTDINLPPAWVLAHVSLHGVFGGHVIFAGIRSYRKRLPSGADQLVDLSASSRFWPSTIYDFVSSITYGVATQNGTLGRVTMRMDYWN